MADSWQTIEQAAVSLRLSVRTVNRHIAAGKLQSRLNEGRREVLVNPSDASAAGVGAFERTESKPPQASHTTVESASTVSVDAETVLALADNAAEKAEMAVTAYQTLARMADTQMKQVRQNARFAWMAVAVMAIATTVMVGWTSHRWTRMSIEADSRLTTAEGENTQLRQQLAADEAKVHELSTSLERVRTEQASGEKALQAEIAFAREQAARAESRLAAYQEQEQARQAQAILVAARSPSAEPPITASTTQISKEHSSDGQAAPHSATTRPLALRRKARLPTTRPTAPSDTSSASTADEP
jgi:hypothetical protein